MKFLYWFPRILMILFIGFISLFAFDVFGEYNFPEILLALFMHLLPTFALIIILIIAWKKELIGGIITILFGIFTIFMFGTWKEPVSFLIISLPVLIIGSMFILHHYLIQKKIFK